MTDTVDRLVARFDHHDPEFTPEVAAAVHRRLREAGEPVHSAAHGGVWVLARYRHVFDALKDHGSFSSAQGVFFPRGADQPRFAPLEYDPPEHTAFRSLMRPALAAAAVRAVEPRIDRLAADIVRPLVARGSADLVAELTTTLPLAVLATTIGFSDTARGEILELTRTTWSKMATGGQFWPQFAALLDAEIARARRDHDGTYLAELVRTEVDGAPVTDEQLRVMLVAFAIAGHETTMNTTGHLLWRLAQDPDLAARLARDPGARPAAVDESLRLDAPVDHGSRFTTRDVEVGRTTIPAGSRVVLAVGAANRDPEQFDDPEAFRLDRGAARHLSLGQGIHFCLGAQLGRRQIVAVLDELAAAPPMTLDGPVHRHYANGRHLNLAALPVRWGG
ncbi:cytochrome P450 [Actinokineospora pegani]|uniref:cytochrome P450 n=1 Tax=Actinokineospora pegani TaxID=2654637 RepID=UPI0012EAA324|nr:cytochrome P450 [Actinokineospora pegani]